MKLVYYAATLAVGAGCGWLYYKFIGCRSGGWSLTSNVWSSVLIGAVFGYLLLSPIIDKYFQKKAEESKTEDQIESTIDESEQER